MRVLVEKLEEAVEVLEDTRRLFEEGEADRGYAGIKLSCIILKKIIRSLQDMEEVAGKEELRTLDITLALLLERVGTINLAEIGRKFGVSRERVRQIKNKIEKKGIRIKTEKEIKRDLLESVFPQVVKEVMEGKSLRKVCKEYRINYDSMLKFFKRRGIDPARLRKRGLWLKTYNLIKEGKTTKQIAKELDLSYRQVQRIINSDPVLKREYENRREKKPFRQKAPVRKKTLIKALLEAGIPPSEIARSLNTYESYVYQIKAQLEGKKK